MSKKIITRLNKRPRCWCWKVAGGPRQRSMLDIVGCDDGRFFSLEVKMPGASRGLTPRQAALIERILATGGIAGEVRSVRDALELLETGHKGWQRVKK